MNTFLTITLVLLGLALALTVSCWFSAERDIVRLRDENSQARTKVRHLTAQATGYRAEVARLSERVAHYRDQFDLLTGATTEPTLTEAWAAFLAELPVTHPEDPR